MRKKVVAMDNGSDEHAIVVDQFSSEEAAPLKWRFKDIDWKFVFRSQLWATALLTIGPVIGLAMVHFVAKPRSRPYYIYDATISYPTHKDTIPTWVAIVIPFIMLLISLIVCEFILMKEVHRNITNAVSTAVHFFVDLVVAFLFLIFMTELTKVVVGRLRPDFLTRCDPIVPDNNSFSVQTLSIGQSTQAAGAAYPCRGLEKTVEDGRLSFPSGHASTATLFAFYHTGYFLWSLYYRHRRSVMGRFVVRRGCFGVFLKDFGQSIAFYWLLAQICFGWGVGISRFIDNKHNISDVIGGFFLGAMIGLIFVLRAIPTSKYVVGRGPEYNMAHSFDERAGAFRPSRQSVVMHDNHLGSPSGGLNGASLGGATGGPVNGSAQPAHGAGLDGGVLRTAPVPTGANAV